MVTPTISEIVIDAFASFAPQLGLVAAAGLAVALTTWGLPKAIGFFKKTAK